MERDVLHIVVDLLLHVIRSPLKSSWILSMRHENVQSVELSQSFVRKRCDQSWHSSPFQDRVLFERISLCSSNKRSEIITKQRLLSYAFTYV
jgi:hypothetical protein